MGESFKPLTGRQRATARQYPWYRRWLLATGRTPAEVDGPPKAQPKPREDGR